jgi:hypothetical protein
MFRRVMRPWGAGLRPRASCNHDHRCTRWVHGAPCKPVESSTTGLNAEPATWADGVRAGESLVTWPVRFPSPAPHDEAPGQGPRARLLGPSSVWTCRWLRARYVPDRSSGLAGDSVGFCERFSSRRAICPPLLRSPGPCPVARAGRSLPPGWRSDPSGSSTQPTMRRTRPRRCCRYALGREHGGRLVAVLPPVLWPNV